MPQNSVWKLQETKWYHPWPRAFHQYASVVWQAHATDKGVKGVTIQLCYRVLVQIFKYRECYDRYFSFNRLSTFSWVHLILSRHVIILSQDTLSFIYFLMRSLSPLCYHSLHLISMLCMAMPSFLLFHSDASCITHVYASILCTAYLISTPTTQGLGFTLCIQYQ